MWKYFSFWAYPVDHYFYCMILQAVTALSKIPKRIVSLVPSQTELLAYLQLGEEVVGITKFCVHPAEWKRSKTIIGGTKNINIAAIKALEPELIIANKEENLKEQVEELANSYPVWVTDVNDLDQSVEMIQQIGILTGKEEKANELTTTILTNFSTIQQLPAPARTAYLIWRTPLMTIGGDNFISDMMSRCGLENVFAHAKRYPQITIGDLQQSNCGLLLLSSEPYPFKKKHIGELQQYLPDVKILLVDGEYFSWYGSRLATAPKYFNQLLTAINTPAQASDL